jgi:hypothetical protein
MPKRITLPAAIAILLTACATVHANPEGTDAEMVAQVGPQKCFAMLSKALRACVSEFPDSTTEARGACTNAATTSLLNCLDTEHNDMYSQILVAFQDRLARTQHCNERFFTSPDASAACKNAALVVLQYELNKLLGDASSAVLPTFRAPRQPTLLVNASETIGSVDADETIVVSGQWPGDRPRSSVVFATYETAAGIKTEPIAADGAPFRQFQSMIHLNALDLVQAEMVVVTVFHIAESGIISGVQGAVVILNDSPVSGDWNRDGVFDEHDYIAFTQGLAAGTNRSDLNRDGEHDSADLLEYVGQLSKE